MRRYLKARLHDTVTPRPTSNVVSVARVDLLHAAVPKGQLPHPVHTAPHPRGQTQVGVVGCCVEPVCGEVVVAANR